MMLLFFQLDSITTKVVDKAFNVSPDTVLGLLIVMLFLTIVALGYAIRYMQNEHKVLRDKVSLLTENAITVITNNSAVLEALGDAIHELKTATPAQIRDAEIRIVEAIHAGAKTTDRILNSFKPKK